MEKREIKLDILRVISLWAVIWVHVGGMETSVLPVDDHNCQWLIFLKSIMTWEIPVYVMISGRFFLDPDRKMPFSKIRKAVGRLALAFVIWNVLYQIYYILSDYYTGLNWKGMLSQALIGPYHFWYLYMIIGLYLITPFLRKIAEDKQLSEYFIGLFFVLMVLTKYIVKLPFVGPTVNSMLDSMSMKFVLGYSGYYVLGYYLYRYPLSNKWERLMYVCAAVFLFAGATTNTVYSVLEGAYTERFTGYTNPNTIIIATAIYTLFIKRIDEMRFSEKVTQLILKLSEHSFGIYLLHALILDLFATLDIKPTVIHPVLAMPLITLMAFMVTYILIAIIRKSEKIGRKIT